MNPKITYFRNGQIYTEIWRDETERLHRLDGPAYQEWDSTGQLEHKEWYITGVRYKTEAEFLVAVDLYKANEIAELF